MDDGVRLACQVKIRQDIRIAVKEEFLHVQEFSAVVTDARMVTPDTREIRLDLREPDRIDFRPGQYVQVFVPGAGETTFRAYSIASPPGSSGQIELLVRLIPGGLGSTYLHTLRVGDDVTFTGPYGEFQLDLSPDTGLVCIGGGCGMAPMRSLLRHVGTAVPAKPCELYFGARTAEHVMYREDFEALRKDMDHLDIHYALSEPEQSPSWAGETGFIHESVERWLQNRHNPQVFLCGPPQMIEAAMEVLENKGIPRDRIFYDEF
jgi:Na+-transporting NADH:ubiquinone oxidoreductase subunit F